MSTLSTHVLDTAHGRPAAGMAVVLIGPDGEIASGITDADGRCPDLAPGPLAPGRYALRFAVAAYFRASGVTLPDPPFLDEVTVDFGIAADGGHYHVPLLVSPFAYSTYRGS
ncbi:hydroxyisourate hydrolase [Sphingomonas sp. M1-B02]|uniref:hydroxyisourate hydrolase n=1 Tax=Sphingomonas sp. M1-B02 TaxID=3114300 RepID=UPI0022408EB1|nr:hydroxyisourate hydrolase [Sphingomonas sp. S6-11]UZK66450.1 hydroxyisourate hydrolase [Sphingomonas sp. S6-11]